MDCSNAANMGAGEARSVLFCLCANKTSNVACWFARMRMRMGMSTGEAVGTMQAKVGLNEMVQLPRYSSQREIAQQKRELKLRNRQERREGGTGRCNVGLRLSKESRKRGSQVRFPH